MFLHTIEKQDVFHKAIPPVPMGKYVHIVLLRETNSFSLFQTDQGLNFARVSAGRNSHEENASSISRIVVFKRKQTTAERLKGRELLHRYGLISSEVGDERYCEYNSEHFCKRCPDCIYYGFAIGQEGSERSKVLVDSAFSLSDYDVSHQTITFNAPYEHGTMSLKGETTYRFGEQDHVLPQIFFPSVITLRDPTEAGFLYVFNNLLRTKRYGAQTTRTGTVENHVVAVLFADGEIFSNLKLTQTLYDLLEREENGQVRKGPYQADSLIKKMRGALPHLVKEDRVTTHSLIDGELMDALLEEVGELVSHETTLVHILQQAYAECEAYYATFGAGANKKTSGEGNKSKSKATKGK